MAENANPEVVKRGREKAQESSGRRGGFPGLEADRCQFDPGRSRSGQVELTEGKLDSARNLLTGILNRKARNAPALLLLGQVEEVAGYPKEAIVYYCEVLQGHPD